MACHSKCCRRSCLFVRLSTVNHLNAYYSNKATCTSRSDKYMLKWCFCDTGWSPWRLAAPRSHSCRVSCFRGGASRGWQDHWGVWVHSKFQALDGLTELWLPLLRGGAHKWSVAALCCSLLVQVSIIWNWNLFCLDVQICAFGHCCC